MSSQAERIISAFGGPAAAARALGLPYTTVQSWAQRGRVPQWRWAEILGAAKANDVPLTASDFLPEMEETA